MESTAFSIMGDSVGSVMAPPPTKPAIHHLWDSPSLSVTYESRNAVSFAMSPSLRSAGPVPMFLGGSSSSPLSVDHSGSGTRNSSWRSSSSSSISLTPSVHDSWEGGEMFETMSHHSSSEEDDTEEADDDRELTNTVTSVIASLDSTFSEDLLPGEADPLLSSTAKLRSPIAIRTTTQHQHRHSHLSSSSSSSFSSSSPFAHLAGSSPFSFDAHSFPFSLEEQRGAPMQTFPASSPPPQQQFSFSPSSSSSSMSFAQYASHDPQDQSFQAFGYSRSLADDQVISFDAIAVANFSRASSSLGNIPYTDGFGMNGLMGLRSDGVYANKGEAVPVCQYFLRGVCKYGDRCHYRHEFPDIKNAEEYKMKMDEHREMNQDRLYSSTLRCQACKQNVMAKNIRFGVLPCCDHIFCLACLREHRRSRSTRSCPSCGRESDYIIPSQFYPRSDVRKQQMVRIYKDNMKTIPCKYHDCGRGNCPYGENCFYMHKRDVPDLSASDSSLTPSISTVSSSSSLSSSVPNASAMQMATSGVGGPGTSMPSGGLHGHPDASRASTRRCYNADGSLEQLPAVQMCDFMRPS